MPLDSKILRDKIIANISGVIDPPTFHKKFAETINEYIVSEAELVGNYIGILTNKNPDPLSGIHKWKPISCKVDGAEILKAIDKIFDHNDFIVKYNKVLSNEIKEKTIFSGISKDNTVTIGNVKILSMDIKMDMSSKPKKQNDAVFVIADGIVNGIFNSIPEIFISATTLVGSGIVTFSKIE